MLDLLTLSDLKPIFAVEELSMEDIANLTKEDLKEIGVRKLKDRIAILNEARKITGEAREESDKEDGVQQRYSFSSSSSAYSQSASSANTSKQASSVAVKKKTIGESPLLLLTTTGPAAEYKGDRFGLYKEEGLHNGVKYYRQLDRSNKGAYMYQYSKEKWYISDILGKNGGSLQNLTSSDTVPVSGWQYADGTGTWPHDGGITVTPLEDMASVMCGDITITMSGEAAKRSDCAGVFKPTGEIGRGRQVFRNPQTGKYLNGHARWGVRDSIDSTAAGILSGCAPEMCPASHRASYSDRFNQKHWRYGDAQGWRDSADIIVTCSIHSK